MLEYLSSPVWEVIGVVLAILGIIVFFRYQKRKILGYNHTFTPLIVQQKELKGKIQILFNGKEVKDVFLAIVKLFNAGNVHISSDDYDAPILIDFGQKTKILTTEILNKSDENMNIKYVSRENAIEVSPFLVNKKDWIQFKTLVTGTDRKCKVKTRITGGKTQYREEKPIFAIITASILLGMAIIMVSVIYFTINLFAAGFPPNDPTQILTWYMPATFIGLLLIVIPAMMLNIISGANKDII